MILGWIGVIIWCLLLIWMSFYVCNQVYKFWGQIWEESKNGIFGWKLRVPERKPENRVACPCAVHEASSWRAGGELPSSATMFLVVLGILSRSEPFHADSFDVIKLSKPLQTTTELIWTWFGESYLKLLKNAKNVRFSENLFSQCERDRARVVYSS